MGSWGGFAWGREVVCIRLGTSRASIDPVFNALRGRFVQRLHLEDPIQLERNLHCVLGEQEEWRLQHALWEAWDTIQRGGIPVFLYAELKSPTQQVPSRPGTHNPRGTPSVETDTASLESAHSLEADIATEYSHKVDWEVAVLKRALAAGSDGDAISFTKALAMTRDAADLTTMDVSKPQSHFHNSSIDMQTDVGYNVPKARHDNKAREENSWGQDKERKHVCRDKCSLSLGSIIALNELKDDINHDQEDMKNSQNCTAQDLERRLRQNLRKCPISSLFGRPFHAHSTNVIAARVSKACLE